MARKLDKAGAKKAESAVGDKLVDNPDSKASAEDILTFKFFVTILIAAIIISIIFHIFFVDRAPVSFTELYFPEPDSLPNEVLTGTPYNFTFVIKSNELKPTTYDYTSRMELFRLYDVTEGIYRCVSRQRKKVNFDWMEGNASTGISLLAGSDEVLNSAQQSSLLVPQALELGDQAENSAPSNQDDETYSGFFMSQTDDYNWIDWPNYNLEYVLTDAMDAGNFTTIFHDKGKIKYTITMSKPNGEVMLSYLNGTDLIKRTERVLLSSNNDVHIIYKGTLQYYLNRELVFNESVPDATAGKFDFRFDNDYFILNRLLLYKDHAIEVTSPQYVKEFDIDNSLIFERIKNLSLASSFDILYNSENVNYPYTCNDSSCREVIDYISGPGSSFGLTVLDYWPAANDVIAMADTGENTFNIPSVFITQNTTPEALGWKNFTIRLSYQLFVRKHAIIYNFDDQVYLLLHDSNMYFFVKRGDAANPVTKAYWRRNPSSVGVNELSVESKNGNMIFYVNRRPLINFETDIPMQKVSIATKDSFNVFSDLVMSKNSPECRRLVASSECRRIFRTASERRLVAPSSTSAVSQAVVISSDLKASPYLQILGAFALGTSIMEGDAGNLGLADEASGLNQTLNGTSALPLNATDSNFSMPAQDAAGSLDRQQLDTSNTLEILSYDINVNTSIINEDIASEKFVFNGPTAVLKNATNYTFSLNFNPLEGLGLLEISFYNENGLLTNFIIYQPEKTAYLFRNYQGTILQDKVFANVTWNNTYNFKIDHKANKTVYSLNYKKILEFDDFDVSNGFFAMATYYTYYELRDLKLDISDLNRVVPFKIDRDPCALKKTEEIIMGQNSLYLSPGENTTVFNSFEINQDFDYGLATVTLRPEQKNETEIHFWVIKNG